MRVAVYNMQFSREVGVRRDRVSGYIARAARNSQCLRCVTHTLTNTTPGLVAMNSFEYMLDKLLDMLVHATSLALTVLVGTEWLAMSRESMRAHATSYILAAFFVQVCVFVLKSVTHALVLTAQGGEVHWFAQDAKVQNEIARLLDASHERTSEGNVLLREVVKEVRGLRLALAGEAAVLTEEAERKEEDDDLESNGSSIKQDSRVSSSDAWLLKRPRF